MATYAIGDVQGCAVTLKRLLERFHFTPSRDRLVFAGDLVNRGAHSLTTLRLVKGLGESAESVLGNHDLHLLALAAGIPKKKDHTLQPILSAEDRGELLGWLRQRPLLFAGDGYVVVHAGLHPAWTLETAQQLARAAETRLRSRKDAAPLLERIGDVDSLDPGAPEDEKLAHAVTVLTRIRTVREDGKLCLKFTGPALEAPRGCLPWFSLRGERDQDVTVVFGHWARNGLHRAPGYAGLDTGCVYGGLLTALRMEDRELFQQPMDPEDVAAKR